MVPSVGHGESAVREALEGTLGRRRVGSRRWASGANDFFRSDGNVVHALGCCCAAARERMWRLRGSGALSTGDAERPPFPSRATQARSPEGEATSASQFEAAPSADGLSQRASATWSRKLIATAHERGEGLVTLPEPQGLPRVVPVRARSDAGISRRSPTCRR